MERQRQRWQRVASTVAVGMGLIACETTICTLIGCPPALTVVVNENLWTETEDMTVNVVTQDSSVTCHVSVGGHQAVPIGAGGAAGIGGATQGERSSPYCDDDGVTVRWEDSLQVSLQSEVSEATVTVLHGDQVVAEQRFEPDYENHYINGEDCTPCRRSEVEIAR